MVELEDATAARTSIVTNTADLESNRAIVEDLVKDLIVETSITFNEEEDEGGDILGTFVGQEFLSAMVIAKGSKLAGKTMEQGGINKLSGVHLFSIERPLAEGEGEESRQGEGGRGGGEEEGREDRKKEKTTTISQEEVLEEGDILWWSGEVMSGDRSEVWRGA